MKTVQTKALTTYFSLVRYSPLNVISIIPSYLYSNGTFITADNDRIKACQDNNDFALNWASVLVNPFSSIKIPF